MRRLRLIGLFMGGFVTGAVAVGLWSGHLISSMTVPKQVDVALRAAQEAEWLAGLRLSQAKSVIPSMENSMDNEVATIASWSDAKPPDEKTRKARDRFLTSVKVYHESYPVGGADAVRINALLATVPGRSLQNTCKSGLCRLNDLRRGILITNFNSP